MFSAVDVTEAHDAGLVSEKNLKVSDKINIMKDATTQTDLMVCDSAPLSSTQENSSNASKSSITTEEREVTGFVVEQPPSKEDDKVEEDQEQSQSSHNTSLHESNISLVVPINHAHTPEIHAEETESGLESLDESNVIEIEGESILDQLKR
jgi:hypothetical protein